MTKVLAGTVTAVEEGKVVFGKYEISGVSLVKVKVGDHVLMSIETYTPEPVLKPVSKRRVDPMLEKGKPSVPGAK